MNKQKSLVEDTFLQMRNLEEVINENAKGILASTMKEEIRSLVKESLNEQEDEDEIEVDAEFDDTDVSDDDVDNLDVDMGDELDLDADDETIDLTDASTEDVLKVFRAMGPEDGVIVKKEEGMIHLSDENNDVEYVIQLSESEQDDEEFYLDQELEEEEEEDDDEEDKTQTIYEVELDETDDEDEDEDSYKSHLKGKFNPEMMERFNMGNNFDEEEDDDEIFDPEMMERFNMEIDPEDEDDEDDEDLFGDDDDEFVVESKSKFKSKGIGMGNSSKFKYDKKPNQGEGFKTKMKQGTRGVGMGKPKFEYKEGENMEKGKNTPVKKIETKESARTLGNGSRNSPNRKSLPKLRVRTHESVSNSELQILREKNEEYRNALNVFRDKLNEVAVFNSNLAYATRLFTEHSTTKQEKINILKRFDTVETLKESKNLYKVVKDELSNVGKESHFVNETFERTVQKTPTSGSAVNLIESKTYENPQFLRMKDLMSKIK
jgi:hypothetical protein